jgi:nucleoside-diphosphate-sugar epimerase
MKYILITGARGFVGASMIEHFLEHTDYVMYYTKRPPKCDDRLKSMDLMNRVFEWNGEYIDIILHAAGNPSSIECIKNPKDAVEDNISETVKTLEIARKYKVKHFIYFSSVEVYGKSGKCFEDDICHAQNMYAATKIAGEQICKAYQSSYDVPCSIVRLNNTFGHFCQEERFPIIAVKKLLNREAFVIHTHNGEIVGRCWTSIYDVAEMVHFILEQPPGRIYNTTHDFMSNLDYLKCIAKSMGINNFNYELVEENVQGRIGNQDAPPDLIRSLGWKSSKPFEERIKDFVIKVKDKFSNPCNEISPEH